MKIKRCFLTFAAFFIIFAQIFTIGLFPVYAHESIIDVNYDNCILDEHNSDGIDEMWYILESSVGFRHVGHEVSTIRYYFEETNPLTGCTWIPDGEPEVVAEEIKNAGCRTENAAALETAAIEYRNRFFAQGINR